MQEFYKYVGRGKTPQYVHLANLAQDEQVDHSEINLRLLDAQDGQVDHSEINLRLLDVGTA